MMVNIASHAAAGKGGRMVRRVGYAAFASGAFLLGRPLPEAPYQGHPMPDGYEGP
jgi:hypothetical protein